MSQTKFNKPIWDRGEAIDEEMLSFTIGDDWLHDQRLVEVDLRGSLAHLDGLLRVDLVTADEHKSVHDGLSKLLASYQAGEWNVEPGDEDVHSAVERRLIDLVGDPGKKLHTGRSRNDQVAVDMRLWLRDAIGETEQLARNLITSGLEFMERHGSLPIPGYTHLRRAMPSSLGDWMGAHVEALRASLCEFENARKRIALCPLGSGAGYGVPLKLDREGVAAALGFEGIEEPVTLTQHSRGRGALAYVTALESLALDLGKLSADLWLFTSAEFAFFDLPVELSTGSSLMPHKRNPDLIELMRGNMRQVVAERSALIDVLRDLPSGYHRDFQLVKPPLFRAHDRVQSGLSLVAKLVDRMSPRQEALALAISDPSLQVTRRLLERAAAGESFRDAYRDESQKL